MTLTAVPAISASRVLRPIAPLVAPTVLENFSTSGNAGTWVTFNNPGSAVKPTAAAPYCTLTNSGTANSVVTIEHKDTSISGLTAAGFLSLDLEFPDGVDANDKFQFILSSNNNAATGNKKIFTGVTFQRSFFGRITMTFPCETGTSGKQWTSINSEVFDGTTFNYWQLNFTKNSSVNIGASRRVILRSISTGSMTRPKIIFGYDAGYLGVYLYAKDLHTTYNVPATVNVTNTFIGSDASLYMDWTQLQAVYNTTNGNGDPLFEAGIRNPLQHDTAGDFSTLLASLSTSRSENIAHGLTRGTEHAVYPVGIAAAYSKAALQAAGIKSCRTTLTTPNFITPEGAGFDPYNMPTCGLAGTDTFNTNGTGTPVKTIIDRAIASGRSLYIYTHNIGPGSTVATGGIAANDLEATLSYLNTLRNAGQCDLVWPSTFINSQRA